MGNEAKLILLFFLAFICLEKIFALEASEKSILKELPNRRDTIITIRIDKGGRILNPDVRILENDSIIITVEPDTSYLNEVKRVLKGRIEIAETQLISEEKNHLVLLELEKQQLEEIYEQIAKRTTVTLKYHLEIKRLVNRLNYLENEISLVTKKYEVKKTRLVNLKCVLSSDVLKCKNDTGRNKDDSRQTGDLAEKFLAQLIDTPYVVQYQINGKWKDYHGMFEASKNMDFHMKVIKIDVFKKFLLEYYNKIVENYQEELSQIRSSMIRNRPIIIDFEKKIALPKYQFLSQYIQLYYPLVKDCPDSCCLKQFDYCDLKQLECYLKLQIGFLEPDSKMKEWLEELFWLNGGNYLFNPFSFTDEEFFSPTLSFSPTYYQNADSVKKIINNKIKYDDIISVKSVITQAFFTSGRNRRLEEIRNYDFSKKPSINKNQFASSYPDDYEIRIAAHNIPKELQARINTSDQEIDEKSYVTSRLVPLVDGMTKLKEGLLAELKIFDFKNLIDIPKPISKVREKYIEAPLYEITCCGSEFQEKKVFLNDTLIGSIYEKLLEYNKLKIMYGGLLPLSTMYEILDTVARYRSEWLELEKIKSPPVEVTYTILAEDTSKGYRTVDTLDVTTFRIGKRRKFTFTTGIAYTFGSTWQTKVTTDANNQLTFSQEQTKCHFVFGIKYFLGKQGIWLSDSRFFIPTYGSFWQRISLFTGFGIDENPTKNLYLGAGIDLLPGFNINSGLHLYYKKNYYVANNVIERTSDTYKFAFPYVSFNIDPELFVKFLVFVGKTSLKNP